MTALKRAFGARRVQAMMVVAIVSAFVAAAALVRAVRIEPAPAIAAETPVVFATLQGVAATPGTLIENAVAAAPFTPAREPAGVAPAEAEAPLHGAQQLQLAGTVVDAERGSFVLLSVSGAPAKVVRVGETIGGYRLRSIAQGSAVLTRIPDGERLELRVPRSR